MKRIKEIAETRVRYGYRRIHVLLKREGWLVNAKAGLPAVSRHGALQLRNKSPKRRVKTQLREDRSTPTAANQVWAMDFVHDQLFDGRNIRVLTVVEPFTGCRRPSKYASNFAAPMSSTYLNGLAERLAI
jgi:putative transposase